MDTTKKRRELKEKDRYVIEKCYKRGDSVSEIAELLEVSTKTITREIKRGMLELKDSELRLYKTYSAFYAQNLHMANIQRRGRKSTHSSNGKLIRQVLPKLQQKWSPDAIIGRLRLEGEQTVCTKTIYTWIARGYITGLHTPTKQYKSKAKQTRVSYRNVAAKRIDERPQEANDRKPGHWEMDLVASGKGGNGYLLVFTERATRTELIYQLKDKKQSSVQAVFDRLERRHKMKFRQIFKTITCDNGSEFLDFEALEKSLIGEGKRTEIYYAHPFSSWERGSNENANKLIRKWIKKGEDISKLPVAYIKKIEKWINNYPRRLFGYRTANEVQNA